MYLVGTWGGGLSVFLDPHLPLTCLGSVTSPNPPLVITHPPKYWGAKCRRDGALGVRASCRGRLRAQQGGNRSAPRAIRVAGPAGKGFAAAWPRAAHPAGEGVLDEGGRRRRQGQSLAPQLWGRRRTWTCLQPQMGAHRRHTDLPESPRRGATLLPAHLFPGH